MKFTDTLGARSDLALLYPTDCHVCYINNVVLCSLCDVNIMLGFQILTNRPHPGWFFDFQQYVFHYDLRVCIRVSLGQFQLM